MAATKRLAPHGLETKECLSMEGTACVRSTGKIKRVREGHKVGLWRAGVKLFVEQFSIESSNLNAGGIKSRTS
jgi:hypothetical protein